MKQTIESAIALAATYHRGQKDKHGEPQILHPLRVMLAALPEDRIVAVLHDVVEERSR
jgi:(p)ppGpp synthase/HD superfamily hydrolase